VSDHPSRMSKAEAPRAKFVTFKLTRPRVPWAMAATREKYLGEQGAEEGFLKNRSSLEL